MAMSKEEHIQWMITKMKQRCDRYKRASDDPQLLKNDLDILYEELEELREVLGCSKDVYYC